MAFAADNYNTPSVEYDYDALNSLLAARMADGLDESNAADLINDAMTERVDGSLYVGETKVGQVSMIAALRREAERIEEDATFSGKSHFNAEDTWLHRNYWLGGTATALGAVAGATLIESQPEWAAALTLLASLLTGLLTVLKPSERAALHHGAGGQYLALRNDARLFREVELLQTDRPDELVKRLKALAARRDELNQE